MILNFGIAERLRTLRYPIFTGRGFGERTPPVACGVASSPEGGAFRTLPKTFLLNLKLQQRALDLGSPFGGAGAGAPERVHFPEEVPLLFLFFCTKCSAGRVFLLTSGQMFRTIFSSMESKTLYAGFSVTLYPFQAKRACLI